METRSKAENIKTILVTGGSRGIGKAICLELAKKGHNIFFTYKSDQLSAEAVLSDMKTAGNGNGQSFGSFRCDMSKDQEVSSLFKELKSLGHRLDVVVNNAGITGRTRQFLLTTETEWWETFDNNMRGVLNTTKFALPGMIARKSGIFVNITSIAGQQGTPGSSAYATSKAAIVAFTKCIYKEHGLQGIYAFSVSPGFVETEMIQQVDEAYLKYRLMHSPLRRPGKACEVANLVAYLADSPPALLGGQEISIDGLQ